jgi:hypothetical protein
MKEIFKKSFSMNTLKPFVLGVGTVLLIEFLIFPGLTVTDLFLNLFSAATLIGLIVFTIAYLRNNL